MQHFFLFQKQPPAGSKKQQLCFWLWNGIILLCAAICLGLMSMYFGSLYFVWARVKTYLDFPMLIFLNVLPVVILVFFLYLLTNRSWLAFGLSWVIVLLLNFSNYYKVVFRSDCLVMEDLKLIGTAAGILGEYTIPIHSDFYYDAAICLLGTVFLALFVRGRLPKLWHRGAGIVTLVLLGAFSWHTWYSSTKLYQSFENYTAFNQWQPTEYHASRGFLYPFIYSAKDLFRPAPEGYSSGAAQALLEEYAQAEIPEAQRVNVVCVMLESFSDPSALPGMEFSEPAYAPLHALQEESYAGTLIVDTFGGSTINSERAFLTGYTYPQPSYRHTTESFVQYVKRQGYTCIGCHPGHDWYYNRSNVNQNLGFDSYHFSEDLFSALTDAEYARDDVFFPAVRTLYEQALEAADSPVFSFSVSYQNHSPYSATELEWGTEYLTRDSVSDQTYYTVNNYLGGIADTCQRLADFVDSFRTDTKPVILVVYGDHKATLGSSNSCYQELGVNLSTATQDGFFQNYSTPYFIWANDAAKAVTGCDFVGQGQTLSPCYLMTALFDLCQWDGTPYMQMLRKTCAYTPVIHASCKYLVDGTFTDTLSDEASAALQNLKIAQYYLQRTTYRP